MVVHQLHRVLPKRQKEIATAVVDLISSEQQFNQDQIVRDTIRCEGNRRLEISRRSRVAY